ncbi:MAG: ATP-binding protein [Chloroflexi bacterium]|nr:ATP-binding protein [Chloroflexota bacterium]
MANLFRNSDSFGPSELDAAPRLGMVVKGSLKSGVDVKLDPAVSVEDPEVQVGRYVVIEGRRQRFFGLITDVALEAIDPQFAVTPPDTGDDFIAEVLQGTATYGTLHVLPSLTVPRTAVRGLEGAAPQPVKTVPSHYAAVHEASEADIALIFGEEGATNFFVGSPPDMESKVCLDLKTFITRSNGVFGKSGTGKTFLTRLLLLGLVQAGSQSDARNVNLVFDMHSEYGWKGYSESAPGREVKGLKQIPGFGPRVAIFSLDEESSRRRGASPDHVVRIGYDEVTPEDLLLLREPLNLHERGLDAAHEMHDLFGKGWLSSFLETPTREIKEALEAKGGSEFHPGSLSALKTSLQRLRRFRFMVEPGAVEQAVRKGSVQAILDYLESGRHVILEFGRYGSDPTAYVLVANLLTRRIHERWVELTEKALGDPVQMPPTLVITIEEAHKFLSREVAPQTIFGNIAREMRKYNVTLRVVDQRPSGIDDEILSQLGTKLCCLLDNERDVDSVLAGVAGRSELREVLAHLESKQQALIFGHAVPMPVVVRVRDYGTEQSYAAFGEGSRGGLDREALRRAMWEDT